MKKIRGTQVTVKEFKDPDSPTLSYCGRGRSDPHHHRRPPLRAKMLSFYFTTFSTFVTQRLVPTPLFLSKPIYYKY